MPIMESIRSIDVIRLDAAHRRAIEDVIGVRLQDNQRLTISVAEISDQAPNELRGPGPTIEDWQSVYDGLTDEQIEFIDRIANTRANLTRDIP